MLENWFQLPWQQMLSIVSLRMRLWPSSTTASIFSDSPSALFRMIVSLTSLITAAILTDEWGIDDDSGTGWTTKTEAAGAAAREVTGDSVDCSASRWCTTLQFRNRYASISVISVETMRQINPVLTVFKLVPKLRVIKIRNFTIALGTD